MPFFLRRMFLVWVCFTVLMCFAASTKAEAFSLISEQEEISIGRDVGKQLEKQYGLVDDPALQERVTRIGMKLVAVCDRPNLPYSFKVLNSKEVNAMAAPGGFIYIFKGLIDMMPTDDELAGVMGHELGHVVKRHTVHQIEKNMGMGILFGVVFGDRGAFLQNLAMNAIMAGYSREDERQADQLGFLHSYKAGYNPYSMLIGLQKLSDMDPDQAQHNDLFSDHPEGRARVAMIQETMKSYKIRPTVAAAANGGAQVVDGNWQLPMIQTTRNGNKPLIRAYFAAGVLYRLSQLPDYSADKYITDSDDTNFTIYYDDEAVITLTPEDGSVQGMSAMDLASLYINSLQQWNR
ncbi:MAG: M48 family metallopeptidase [Veillonellales bacterium]